MTEIISTKNFSRRLKNLAKKYQSLKNDLNELIEDLRNNPTQGAILMPNVYKIRLGVKSKGGGKSGGLRVITHVEVVLNAEIIDNLTFVRLITIYDKFDFAGVNNENLQELIDDILEDEQEDNNEN
jgi:mRNA-degrading endonuclease RelE of RelBE toxin-antitoxin system